MNRVMAHTVMSLFLLAIGCASTPTPKLGPFNSDLVTDGVYEGSATIWPVKAVVKVAIENRRIARIDILEHRTMLGGPAEEVIPAKIIEKQSTNVDAVSGATMSSDAIMDAVQLAIEGASKVESSFILIPVAMGNSLPAAISTTNPLAIIKGSKK